MPKTADTNDCQVRTPWYASARLALVGALAALLFCFARYVGTAAQAIQFPYGIDYGEGIVWQQMHMIIAGKGYGPIAGFPSIAFPYPPLFYVASSLMASLTGMDELAAGRLFSVACAVAAAGIVASIAVRFARNNTERFTYRICGALAALIALSTEPVLEWSLLMRVDLFYVALSLIGFRLAIAALIRPMAIHGAALFFVAAIFTKQIAVAAPIAVFATLLFLHPRTACAGIATFLATGIIALAVMMWLTDGGFILHVGFYTITQFNPALIVDVLQVLGLHIVYCVLAVWIIWSRLCRFKRNAAAQQESLRQYLRANASDTAFVMAVAYFFMTSILLVAALKRGSSVNYFLEWIYLIGLFAGVALVHIMPAALWGISREEKLRAPLILWCIAIQALGLSTMIGEDYYPKAAMRPEQARLVALVKAAPLPVISDDMVAVVRAGKTVQWEPFIFAQLAAKGAWDEAPLIAKIKAKRFAFFVTEGSSGDNGNYDERYDPAVSAAIRSAYPLRRRLAGYNLNFPGNSPPAYAHDVK
jgi:hypothetical protein